MRTDEVHLIQQVWCVKVPEDIVSSCIFLKYLGQSVLGTLEKEEVGVRENTGRGNTNFSVLTLFQLVCL